jgi:hypothetical protein
MAIPIGGGIIEGTTIYEPLRDGSFLVSEPLKGRRYIVDCEPGRKDVPPSITLGDRTLFFNGEPTAPFWHTPDMEKAQAWVDGELKAIPSREAYGLLKKYFEAFADFEDSYSSTILTLFAVQTHMKSVLNSLFQLPISGPFGSGKSAVLLALADVCYHPFSEASATPAARTRVIGQVGPSYFSDEIDKTTQVAGEEDNAALVILRVGYRRGMKYLRWDTERNTWTAIEIFFPLAYTFSSEVEQAFKQRSITEIAVSKSVDARVPVVNTLRAWYAAPISEALFFWRMEFLEDAIRKGTLQTDSFAGGATPVTLEELSKMDAKAFRAKLYSDLTRDFSSRDRFILERVFGREAELCYVALTVQRALNVDVVDELAAALNRQLQTLIAEPDARFVEFRRLIIATTTGEMVKAMKYVLPPDANVGGEGLAKLCVKAYFDQMFPAPIQIPVSPLIEDVHAFAKDHKLSEKIGPRTFGTWYRKLGIISGRDKLHGREGDFLRINFQTWQKINHSIEAEEIKLDGLPRICDPNDSSEASGAPKEAFQP